jgi:hypothetical protein
VSLPHISPVWLWALGLAVMLWLFHRARGSMWMLALLTLPGTIAHEFCHLLVGWVLGAQPKKFTVLPTRTKDGCELGSVAFSNLHWYNAFFAGIAPLALLAGAWFLVQWRLHHGLHWSWMNLLWLYLVANLIASAPPSAPDWRIAARSPIGWLLLIGAGIWAWFHFQKKPVPLPKWMRRTVASIH